MILWIGIAYFLHQYSRKLTDPLNVLPGLTITELDDRSQRLNHVLIDVIQSAYLLFHDTFQFIPMGIQLDYIADPTLKEMCHKWLSDNINSTEMISLQQHFLTIRRRYKKYWNTLNLSTLIHPL